MLDPNYLDAIKNFEGYAAQSRWDYAQNTNGYGTKARFAGEVIDKTEADKRFTDEIKKAADFVDKFAPGLDDGSKAALTSLTYNTGTAWTQDGLGQAVANGDLAAAKSIFLQYNKAGGSTLDGLVQRRLQEVTWFGQGTAGTDGGPAAGPQVVAAAAESALSAAFGTAEQGFADFTSAVGDASASSSSDASAGSNSSTSPFAGLSSDRVLLSLLSEMAKNDRATANDAAPRQPDDRAPTA
jgi:lysozyme